MDRSKKAVVFSSAQADGSNVVRERPPTQNMCIIKCELIRRFIYGPFNLNQEDALQYSQYSIYLVDPAVTK